MNSCFKNMLISKYFFSELLFQIIYSLPKVNAFTTEGTILGNSTVRYKLEFNKTKIKKTNATLNGLKQKNQSISNESTTNIVNHITTQFWYQETFTKLMKNGAVNRGMYILIGMTSILLIYFLIKAISIKKRRRKVKKYGILNGGDFDYDTEEANGVGDWGESWSRKYRPSTKANNKTTKNGAAHKWEMTPLDHFDPNGDSHEDEDDASDLDLYRAPAPRVSSKTALPKTAANQLYYKSTLTSDPSKPSK